MKTVQVIFLVAVLVVAGTIIGVKTWGRSPEVPPVPPPATPGAARAETGPGTLLLFNRNMGCQCVMKLYAAADSYFNKIDPELAAAFHARRINADELPDLVEAHNIIVAPTMIILDPEGNEVLRQESRIDIKAIEDKLRELLARGGDA